MIRPRPSFRAHSWLACLALALAPAALAQEPTPSEPPADGALETIETPRIGPEAWLASLEDGAEEELVSRVARELADLGPAVTDELLLLMEQRSVAGAVLSRTREAALLEALALRPRQELRRALDALVTVEADEARRLAVLRVLASLGRGEDLELVLRTARPPTPEQALARTLAIGFERCVQRILQRDPEAFVLVKRQLPNTREALRASLIHAVARTDSPRALPLLGHLLSRRVGHDELLLGHIGRLALVVPLSADDGVRRAVRELLREDRFGVQREAALAAGKLEDPDAVPILIELLYSKNRGLRDNGLWALQRISGLKLNPDPAGWERWLAAEQRWWREEANGLFLKLASGDDGDFARAVQEIARHRHRRDDLARELVRGLNREGPLGGLVCAALSQIGSAEAVPELIAQLDSPDENRRGAAWQALKRITGQDLPPERQAWTAAP